MGYKSKVVTKYKVISSSEVEVFEEQLNRASEDGYVLHTYQSSEFERHHVAVMAKIVEVSNELNMKIRSNILDDNHVTEFLEENSFNPLDK